MKSISRNWTIWTLTWILSVSLFGENISEKTSSVGTNSAKRAVLPIATRPWEKDMPKVAKKPKEKKAPPPSPQTVLVNVNGKDITYGQLTAYTDFMAFLLKNRKPKISSEDLARFKKKNLVRFSETLFQRAVIGTCLAASNLTVTAAAREYKEHEFVRNFARKGQAWPELRKAISDAGYEREFKDSLDFDVKFKVFVDAVYSNAYYASAEDLAKTKLRLAAYNKRAIATNEFFRAHAEEVLKEVRKKGADFSMLAEKYSQDAERDPGGSLGDCDENDFLGEKHIWQAVSNLKPGEVTDVLESEDGYVIVKLEKRNTAEQSQTGMPSLTLSRIFFRRAYLYPDESDEDLMKDIIREKREALMGRLFKVFRKESRVLYPNGHIKAS